MKALLLIAHGSRREESNQEVFKLAEQLKLQSPEHYAIFHAGFLEIASPLIEQSIDNCIADGATSIVVLPYFLNSGHHVIDDIPNMVNKAKQTHPTIDIQVAPHIGASSLMSQVLITSANAMK